MAPFKFCIRPGGQTVYSSIMQCHMLAEFCRRIAKPLALFALLAVTGCTGADGLDNYLYRHAVAEPGQDEMTVCHGYRCQFRTRITLEQDVLQRLDGLFGKPALSAAEERGRIVLAVALLEQHVGSINGTSADSPGYTGRGGDPTQLDCVDESTNGTVYISLLQNRNLLQWHRVRAPVSRGHIIDLRWYHQGTMLADLSSGEKFVLDTWFRRNGEPGYLLPLAEWQAGDGIPARSLTPL